MERVMNYINIVRANCVDYLGWSVTLQVSGCNHKCDGCFAKKSWNRNSGHEFTEETYTGLKEMLCVEYINNLVIQGGDGLFSANVKHTIDLCRRIKHDLPNLRIVLFTGYTLNQIQSDLLRAPILDTIDVLVDGKYDPTQSSDLPFRGSDNQRRYSLCDGIPTLID